jgi:hypothetical protein
MEGCCSPMSTPKTEFSLAVGAGMTHCGMKVHIKANFTQVLLSGWGGYCCLLSTVHLTFKAFKIFFVFPRKAPLFRRCLLLTDYSIS